MATYSESCNTRWVFRGDRLEALMRQKGLSQSEMARRVGVSQATIWKLVKEPSQGSKHLHKIAEALETTPSYLLGEVDDASAGYVAPPSVNIVADELGLVPVREFDLAFGMGEAFMDRPGEVLRVQYFPREWLRAFTNSAPEDLFFAISVGDSMMPTMVSGDIVLIDSRQKVVEQADLIWAFTLEGMGMIKRLGPGRNGQVEIISDNQSVRPRHVVPTDLHVIGRVVAVVRKM